MKRLLLVAAFAVVLAGAVASIGQMSAYAQEAQSLSIVHRILQDDSNGNSKGWNPNGSQKWFIIKDSTFDPALSTVIINTKQRNYPVCSVDYWIKGAFEVNCNIAPANGGILSYVIINTEASTSSTSIASLSAPDQSEINNRQQQNQNQGPRG